MAAPTASSTSSSSGWQWPRQKLWAACQQAGDSMHCGRVAGLTFTSGSSSNRHAMEPN
jgi:hypothetical protein